MHYFINRFCFFFLDMDMKVRTLSLWFKHTNCYVIGNEKECIVVDPGSRDENDISLVLDAVGSRSLLAVIATHGHYDHILGISHLNPRKVIISPKDYSIIEELNRKIFRLRRENVIPGKAVELSEEKHYDFNGIGFEIINTPGHTPGGICLLFDGFIITGDTLFRHAYGRTDLFGGDEEEMMRSLCKLAGLSPGLRVFPGHGEKTTMSYEKEWIERLLSKPGA
jgi:glyoxylase-like metal-dependent hydrolase (beta-lactamase superfamily II)